MYLILILDWYSRKIVSWGLFPQVTSHEVVAVITEAVARERLDELAEGSLKPRLVLDHGSANVSRYTRNNVEVQGLDLWLSGIGRPTGNARTERVIGTLKREEIELQAEYGDEEEARKNIWRTIDDYNYRRPNSGNGGFAPNSVHVTGRSALCDRRARCRQNALKMRMYDWQQRNKPSSSEVLT